MVLTWDEFSKLLGFLGVLVNLDGENIEFIDLETNMVMEAYYDNSFVKLYKEKVDVKTLSDLNKGFDRHIYLNSKGDNFEKNYELLVLPLTEGKDKGKFVVEVSKKERTGSKLSVITVKGHTKDTIDLVNVEQKIVVTETFKSVETDLNEPERKEFSSQGFEVRQINTDEPRIAVCSSKKTSTKGVYDERNGKIQFSIDQAGNVSDTFTSRNQVSTIEDVIDIVEESKVFKNIFELVVPKVYSLYEDAKSRTKGEAR